MTVVNLKLPKPYFETKLGKLYLGDCAEIMPHIKNVELVVTDPQYQLADGKKATVKNKTKNRGGPLSKGMVPKVKDWNSLQGDDKPFDPKHLLAYPKSILWGANHYANKLPNSTSWLVWDKRDGVNPDNNADCELAWSNIGGPTRIHRQLWKGMCRAGSENIAIQGAKLHPFQKPLALIVWCLSLCPNEKIILDPYIGSGTTAVACEILGRCWYGIEIEKEYCDTTVKRLKKELTQIKLPGF